jgi:hypothetical protein
LMWKRLSSLAWPTTARSETALTSRYFLLTGEASSVIRQRTMKPELVSSKNP